MYGQSGKMKNDEEIIIGSRGEGSSTLDHLTIYNNLKNTTKINSFKKSSEKN